MERVSEKEEERKAGLVEKEAEGGERRKEGEEKLFLSLTSPF
jgi:hypothetical protein